MTQATQIVHQAAPCPTWCVDHDDWGVDVVHRGDREEVPTDGGTITARLLASDAYGWRVERLVSINDQDLAASFHLTPAQAVEFGQRLIALGEQART